MIEPEVPSEQKEIQRRKLTRREWIGAVAGSGVIAAAGYGRFIEPNLAFVSRHAIGVPSAVPPLRLVQLSDLHLRDIGRHERDIARKVAELQPGLVLLTGDVIDAAANLHLADAFLEMLDDQIPKLAILGNWEYWGQVDVPRLTSIYEQHNTQLLRNESVTIPHGGRTLVVLGLDDFVGGIPDLGRASDGISPSPNVLLMEHCPAYRDTLGAPRVLDLPVATAVRPQIMLSGHTHGGQVAPFGFAPWRPYGSGRYLHGWYDAEGTSAPRMYVSRGLGTSIIPVRVFAPPEIAVFDWHLATR